MSMHKLNTETVDKRRFFTLSQFVEPFKERAKSIRQPDRNLGLRGTESLADPFHQNHPRDHHDHGFAVGPSNQDRSHRIPADAER